MTTVTFTTVAQEFPLGTVAGVYSVKIIDSTTGVAVEAQNVESSEAIFTLNAGTYKASVQLMDTSNNPLGDAVLSDEFTVVATVPVTVSLMVPGVVTVV